MVMAQAMATIRKTLPAARARFIDFFRDAHRAASGIPR